MNMVHEPVTVSSPLAKQVVKRQLNRSGNILMSASEPMSDEDFFVGGSNGISVAWTIGHLACVMDLFGSWLSDTDRRFPASTHQVFNALDIGAKGPEKCELVDPEQFSKGDILLLLRQAQVRLLEILEEFDITRWDEACAPHIPDTLPTYGAIWEALGVHTYWHLGELCGAHARFHGTYTLNSVLHYFYVPPKRG